MKTLKLAVVVLSTGFIVSMFIVYGAATARESASAEDAKALFDSKCAKCHGKDGRAKTIRGRVAHARDLTAADWQSSVSDERIYNSISNGKGKMPAFKKKLTDDQIDALASYVRRLR